jgi:NitT/TauT family transport system ATP-binding protein
VDKADLVPLPATVKISCRGISHAYGSVSREVTSALEDIDFDVTEHEVVCLVGPSGCGKSTLLYIIAGLLQPTAGTVTVSGRLVTGPGPDRAVVFQQDAVFPWYTVAQNVEYGPRVNGVPALERRERVARLIRLVALDGQERKYPKELSGGMRKRVDLARAYSNEPEFLLMDEPFGALDAMTKENMQTELQALVAARPTTIVFVTHDLEEALFLGDRVVVMSPRPGRIADSIDVPFDRPRPQQVRTSTDFQSLRQRLREMLANEEANAPVDSRSQRPDQG